MRFWGVEVKAREPLKVEAESGKYVHISQVALGEAKKYSRPDDNIRLKLKVGNKEFIVGSLSTKDRTHAVFDLDCEREFELSHDWHSGSVYFFGSVIDAGKSSKSSSSGDDDSYKPSTPLLGSRAAASVNGKKSKVAIESSSDEDMSSSSDDDKPSTSLGSRAAAASVYVNNSKVALDSSDEDMSSSSDDDDDNSYAAASVNGSKSKVALDSSDEDMYSSSDDDYHYSSSSADDDYDYTPSTSLGSRAAASVTGKEFEVASDSSDDDSFDEDMYSSDDDDDDDI